MARALSRALLFFLLVGASLPAAACSIVYGSDWAFVSESPKGWDSACGDGAMDGTAITLWPAGHDSARSDALIYVTVSETDPSTLESFARDEQGRFKQSFPTSNVFVLDTPKNQKTNCILVRYEHASGGREELVAYMDGPSAYYIIVLTAATVAELDKERSAFLGYVADFIPTARK